MLWLSGALFVFLWFIARKFRAKFLWWLPYTLLALAVFAFAFAPVPFTDITVAGVLAAVVEWVLGFVGGLIGAPASVIAGVMLFCLLVAGLVDLFKDRKPDGWAKTMLYAAPVLALVASGPFAPQILALAQQLGGVGPTLVEALT